MDSFEEKFPWNFMPYHQGYPMPGAMMPVESPMVPWMGMAGGYPVYPANMYPQAYLDEMQNERDMKKMKELYPEVAKDVLSVVEDECDQMEYDGSMMFDEYPDKVMFERIKNRIYDKVQEKYPVEEEDDRDQAMVMQQEVYRRYPPRKNWLGDIIEVLLYQEMYRRRCRRRSCRRREPRHRAPAEPVPIFRALACASHLRFLS